MRTSNRALAGLVIALLPTLAGCLDTDRMQVTYEVGPGLSGRFELYAFGVHSNEADATAQRKEMAGFYESFEETVAELVRGLALTNLESAVEGRTELRCDAVVRGDFKRLGAVLAATHDHYRLERTRDRLLATLRGDKGVTFRLRYAGKVLDQNATRVDEATNTYEWDPSDGGEIRFVLATD